MNSGRSWLGFGGTSTAAVAVFALVLSLGRHAVTQPTSTPPPGVNDCCDCNAFCSVPDGSCGVCDTVFDAVCSASGSCVTHTPTITRTPTVTPTPSPTPTDTPTPTSTFTWTVGPPPTD